jgi:DNA mismatch endonuclease, patch repair protein
MPDNLTKDQRSYCMARVRNRDTDLERRLRSELHRRGFRFRKHVRDLPGTPDIVFPSRRIVVFVDGDFWHGYRFPAWRDSVSEFWQAKIEKNRQRDRRNHRALHRMGWTVIRVWQHEIRRDLEACLKKITVTIGRNKRLKKGKAALDVVALADESPNRQCLHA